MLTTIDRAFHLAIRTAARSILIRKGPMTGSDLVRAMGLDPRRHKGTIHAVLVDLETRGQLAASRNEKTGKRDLWFSIPNKRRKRDLLLTVVVCTNVNGGAIGCPHPLEFQSQPSNPTDDPLQHRPLLCSPP